MCRARRRGGRVQHVLLSVDIADTLFVVGAKDGSVHFSAYGDV